MLNICLPHIAVQKVENGYVIQWQAPAKASSSRPTVTRTEIAANDIALIDVIQRAALDVAVVE